MLHFFKSEQSVVRCIFRRSILILFAFVAQILLVDCRSTSIFKAPETMPDDRQRISKPKPQEVNIVADIIEKQLSNQLEQSFDLSRQLRNLTGRRKQAMNVDAFDEVRDSSWFTNRNAKEQMSQEEFARGPDTLDGLDLSSAWTIFNVKAEGVTVGFHIEDGRGDKYVIKFDPKGYSEMPSGAEIVSTKLFYAAGYNVPENYIVCFNPKILKLGENVKFTDRMGRKRLMTRQDLDELLNKIEYLPDGRFRATASRYLIDNPDNFLGRFKYQGSREDDPNDFIPHEYRRELRGLRVMAAWLNHFDTKANNTLDIFTDEGFVRHYLIDFGSTLGSNGDEPMPPEIGFENSFDVTQMFINLITFGFYVKQWEFPREIRYPSIGFFSSKNFHPQKYEFIIPNPAFENMTNRDGFWGAKLVMSFTDEQIKAAVEEGQYSDPQAAEYLYQTLIERRNITGKYWFNLMNSLDRFEIRERSDGIQELCFIDFAVKTGLEKLNQSQYRYDLRTKAGYIHKAKQIGHTMCIKLPNEQFFNEGGNLKKGKSSNEGIYELKLQIKRKANQNWSKWVKVFLRFGTSSKRYSLLGISRQE